MGVEGGGGGWEKEGNVINYQFNLSHLSAHLSDTFDF